MGFDFFKQWSLIALLASSLVAADAYGQRGERGGRGDGGGRGGGEQRASSGGGRGGGEGRSFSRGGGGDRGGRSIDRGSSNRGSSEISRSFRGGQSGRGSFETGQSVRRSSDFGNMQRDFSRGSRSVDGRQFDRQQFSRSQQFDGSRQRTFRSGDLDGMRSARLPSEGGRRQYQTARPTDEQVRDFLRLRRDGQRQGGEGNRDVTRDFNRDGRNRRGDNQNLGRRDVDQRLGDASRGDRQFRREGNEDGRGNVADRIGERGFRDGNMARNLDNRDYRRWRDNAWSGDGDRNGDNRDWSGRWREGNRFASADRIRNRWRDRDWDEFPFHGDWWSGTNWHGRRWGHWDRWSHNRPWYWWTWVAAPRLFGWFDYGWRTPYYWDYGPGEYIYYDAGGIYVNGRWYQPGPVYYENTVRLVERAPNLTPEQADKMEWLPLGVFAVSRDGRAEAELLVQLAVTQDGVMGGTATDQRTGAAYPIEGVVEKETQRAVWSFTDDRNQRIVMETSIFNLTQPEATGLVHYGPDNIQVVELVRLEAPQGQAAPSGSSELPAPPPTY